MGGSRCEAVAAAKTFCEPDLPNDGRYEQDVKSQFAISINLYLVRG